MKLGAELHNTIVQTQTFSRGQPGCHGLGTNRVVQCEAPMGLARATQAQLAACDGMLVSLTTAHRYTTVKQSAEAAGKPITVRVVTQQQTL